MLLIRGLYEVSIRVTDLARSEAFYRGALGLDLSIRDDTRRCVFLRAGGEAGMLVLQEDKGHWPTQHFAFAVKECDIDSAAIALRRQGLAAEGPVHRGWMSVTSVFVQDPDGHIVELCATVQRPVELDYQ